MRYSTLILSILFTINVYSSQVSFKDISLKKLVTQSEYILLVKKVSTGKFKISKIYYGTVKADGPKSGKIINIKKTNITDKVSKGIQVSRIHKRYIPLYITTLENKLKNIRGKLENSTEVYLKLKEDYRSFLHEIERKIVDSGSTYKSVIKVSLMLGEMLKESRRLQSVADSINLTESRKQLKNIIVFLKHVNGDNYLYSALNAFEHPSNEDEIIKSIANKIHSSTGTNGQTLRYKR